MDDYFLDSYTEPRDTAGFDYATLLGVLCAFGLVTLAIVLGGQYRAFFDLSSILIVFGGTIGATLITFPLDEVFRAWSVGRTALFVAYRPSIDERIGKITELARKARSNGILSLEPLIRQEPDPFFRKTIQLVVDALPEMDIRRILELELNHLDDRHRRGAQIFHTMGAVAPAMGLIGTLIGLVQMLQNLDDPSQIGPGMATALLTTFYGAMLSYVLFLPIAGKLRARSQEEFRFRELTIEGMLAIAKEVNPRLLEQRLESFLPPEDRRVSFD